MASIADFIKEWESDSDYILAHTSGSTGTPKEIHLLKSDMRVSARATNKRFGIDSRSTIAAPLSVDYIAGKMMVVRALEAGCKLIEMPISNNVTIPCPLDLLAIVPSQVESLLYHPDQLAKIGNLIIGGAPLSEALSRRLVRSGVKAFATYGMTETCSHVALAPIGTEQQIFTAMPGVKFRLDSRGCLVIVAPEYSFETLVTNDLAELRSPTDFIWLGRYDNVINSGGIKIAPEQLEKEISKFISNHFAITRLRDKRWGEVPVMIFEGPQEDEDKIHEILRSKIDHRRCPKKVIAVEVLPCTANGKISRKELEVIVDRFSIT